MRYRDTTRGNGWPTGNTNFVLNRRDPTLLAFKPVHPPKGTVTRLELVGIHNCCGGCTKAIKRALASVKGVQADTVKPKQTSFVVEGEFKAAEVIETVFNAGFHCDVKK